MSNGGLSDSQRYSRMRVACLGSIYRSICESDMVSVRFDKMERKKLSTERLWAVLDYFPEPSNQSDPNHLMVEIFSMGRTKQRMRRAVEYSISMKREYGLDGEPYYSPIYYEHMNLPDYPDHDRLKRELKRKEWTTKVKALLTSNKVMILGQKKT